MGTVSKGKAWTGACGNTYGSAVRRLFREPQYLRDCRLEDLGSILRPVDEDIDKAVSFIDKAHSCAIIAGGGALAAGKEITKLAEKIAAPIVTTCAGKGLLTKDMP